MAAPNRARVGVGVFVLNDEDQFVLGLRKGSHGAGTWALPGGHLEFGEDFEDCAVREIKEETGLDISDVRFLTATNDVMSSENKHYVTVFVTARVTGSQKEPELLEPDKCERWEWKDWEQLRGMVESEGQVGQAKMFLPIVNLFKQRPGLKLAQD